MLSEIHFCTPEVDRKQAQDMSDDISESLLAYSEATFDYSTTEPSQKMSDYLA